MTDDQATRVRRRDETLARWGGRGWSFVGITAAGLILFTLFSMISGLVVPLLVAAVVGALFVPVVDRLDRWMPRPVAAALVLALVSVAATTVIVVAVAGVIEQAGEIGDQLAKGYDKIAAWLDDLGFELGSSDPAIDATGDLWAAIVPGLTSYLGTVFSGAASFLAGSFVGLFLLYFVLADWEDLTDWVAGHLGVEHSVGRGVVDDSTWALRQYFAALTSSSLVVAVIVGITAAVIDIPLAFTIAVVTFMTSYVPYLGAIFSGAFAVLIALGAGGTTDALIMLLVVLVTQNGVQPVMQTVLTEGRLKLHPIVIFGSTIAGGALFGLFGAAISTPVVAIGVLVTRRLSGPPPDAPETA